MPQKFAGDRFPCPENFILAGSVAGLAPMPSITESELVRAIERTLVARGKMPAPEARPVARMVLGYFGADDTVLDNKLSSEDRDRFYQLEEEGLLTSEEEDATVSRGKTWRIHYWLLKKARIRDVGQAGDAPPSDESEAVYRSIGEAAWDRRGDPHPPPKP
ncbi:MAG TPA: DUF6015 family protein [Thermoplasmata archaeon]|nr:DUF6015 family protein [Thermoplasmata archaeon]